MSHFSFLQAEWPAVFEAAEKDEKLSALLADKRQISDEIEELLRLAALRPTTIGVPEYRDDVRGIPPSICLRREKKNSRPRSTQN